MEMEKPLVSIVIPFYNNGTTLLDAIKSVFSQTYKNWELILLNDGSTDESLTVASSINDHRVKVINDGKNCGLVFRLNQAPSLVSGDFIARMDGDDLMHPERLEKQMKMFFKNPDLDLVDTGAYSIDEFGKPIGVRGLVSINYEPTYIIKNAMLLHASIIGKKEWFEKNKYNPYFIRAEDRELWLRTFKTTKFARVQEPLYIVREGKVNLNNYIKSLKTVVKIYKIFGPKIFTGFELKIEILKSYFKIAVLYILGFLNVHDFVTKRRNGSLTLEELEYVNKMIRNIQSIAVVDITKGSLNIKTT
jgi:glycosyltransferase involved in cell wall biosynthesis